MGAIVSMLVAAEYLIDTASENITARNYLDVEPLRDTAITEDCSVGLAQSWWYSSIGAVTRNHSWSPYPCRESYHPRLPQWPLPSLPLAHSLPKR